jgi:mono/diheme cytochrome c family protein
LNVTRLICLLFAASFLAAQEPQSRPARPNFFGLAPAPDPLAVQRGQQSFVANCGFCHGSTARGGNGGPDLVRSVVVLDDEGSGTQVGPVILEGRPVKGMPKFAMTAGQIKDIAAFLLSLSHVAVNRGDYKILNVVTGDSKAGMAYFNIHCSACHSPAGDLAHIAAKYEPPALQARFLYPKARLSTRAQITVKVTRRSGQSFSGTLSSIDDFSVALVDASGQYRSWLIDEEGGIKVALNDPLVGHEQLLKSYTDADMHNVVAYLETLR